MEPRGPQRARLTQSRSRASWVCSSQTSRLSAIRPCCSWVHPPRRAARSWSGIAGPDLLPQLHCPRGLSSKRPHLRGLLKTKCGLSFRLVERGDAAQWTTFSKARRPFCASTCMLCPESQTSLCSWPAHQNASWGPPRGRCPWLLPDLSGARCGPSLARQCGVYCRKKGTPGVTGRLTLCGFRRGAFPTLSTPENSKCSLKKGASFRAEGVSIPHSWCHQVGPLEASTLGATTNPAGGSASSCCCPKELQPGLWSVFKPPFSK